MDIMLLIADFHPDKQDRAAQLGDKLTARLKGNTGSFSVEEIVGKALYAWASGDAGALRRWFDSCALTAQGQARRDEICETVQQFFIEEGEE